jgi:hypothetical protein
MNRRDRSPTIYEPELNIAADSNTSSQVDTRMKKLCDNVKATGATIYTVQIGAGQSAVLPYCASGPGNLFMLRNQARSPWLSRKSARQFRSCASPNSNAFSAGRIGVLLPILALNGRNRNLDECQLLGKERTSKLHNV